MTCADCRDFSTCDFEFKSLTYSEDGDSVANHCDEFNSIHNPKEVIKNGIVVHQTPRGGIYAYDESTGKLIYHALCYEMKTDEELKQTADFIKNQLSKIVQQIENGGEKNNDC